MKRLTVLLIFALALINISCGKEDSTPDIPEIVEPDDPETPVAPENSKILVAYFSWGGTTRRMAEQIARETDGTLFEITPVTPYPAEYTPCTEVALEERDNNTRPSIKDKVGNWSDYDVVFIGCPASMVA